MFKVNYKVNRMTHAPCSSVSIVNFEHANANWVLAPSPHCPPEESKYLRIAFPKTLAKYAKGKKMFAHFQLFGFLFERQHVKHYMKSQNVQIEVLNEQPGPLTNYSNESMKTEFTVASFYTATLCQFLFKTL